MKCAACINKLFPFVNLSFWVAAENLAGGGGGGNKVQRPYEYKLFKSLKRPSPSASSVELWTKNLSTELDPSGMQDTTVLDEARAFTHSRTLLGMSSQSIHGIWCAQIGHKIPYCFMKTSESVDRECSKKKGSKRIRISKF